MRFFMASAVKNGQIFQNWPSNAQSRNLVPVPGLPDVFSHKWPNTVPKGAKMQNDR